MARTELPKLGTNAKHRVWARASFGNAEDQFGKVKTEGETFPPQGFVASPDGRLLVLDTGKQRLVRYSPDGQLEKSIALPKDTLVMPADVAIAKDGTIAVIDYPGLQTKGTVLLDAEGNRKAELPQLPDTVRGLYAAGNDFYVDTDGLSSVKLGNTQGLPDADAPGLPQDDSGRIPGQVAPDGVTVLRLNAENLSAGEFSISAMRGSPAQEVFTHFYKYPGLSSIPFLQADPAGRIYMVINWPGQFALVCLDGKTGNPAGMVELPFPSIDSGTQLRMFNVAPQGGLVYERPTASGVSFEWFNCFP
jgi:hypothetical protein